MITGLREFRKTLSKHISFIRQGQIVIITDRDKPIASFISIDRLREIAKKANDDVILSQLKEAQIDKNKEFMERKNSFGKEISYYINESIQGKNRVPMSVITKLQTVRNTIRHLISDDGNLVDQRVLDLMIRKSREPISRVLDFDYYHVHQKFVDTASQESKRILEKTNLRKGKSSISKDLNLLVDMTENAIVRDKEKGDDEVKGLGSVLVRMTKAGKFYSSRIYTIMPYWYERPGNHNYFIDPDSSLAIKLFGSKVGHKLKYNGYQYEILSIS